MVRNDPDPNIIESGKKALVGTMLVNTVASEKPQKVQEKTAEQDRMRFVRFADSMFSPPDDGKPHPLRCETCSNKTSDHIGCEYFNRCNITKERIWSHQYEITSKIGCASHSSAQDAEKRIADVIELLESRKRDIETFCKPDFKATIFDQEYQLLTKAIALLRGEG